MSITLVAQAEHSIQWNNCESSNIYFNGKKIITETSHQEFYIGNVAALGHYEVTCVKFGNESKKASIYLVQPEPANQIGMSEQ